MFLACCLIRTRGPIKEEHIRYNFYPLFLLFHEAQLSRSLKQIRTSHFRGIKCLANQNVWLLLRVEIRDLSTNFMFYVLFITYIGDSSAKQKTAHLKPSL